VVLARGQYVYRLCSNAVVLKVGGIAHLGAILRVKWDKKPKGG